MENKVVSFLDTLSNESEIKYSAIRNFTLVKSGKSIVSDGSESFDAIVNFLSDVTEFIFDNYKSLLDWLATTEIVIDKVTYKTRQNNIRYLQTLYKENKDLNKKITFLEIKDFKAPVITGLRCDLKTYVNELATHDYYSTIVNELTYLGELAETLIDNNGFTKDKQGNIFLDLDNLNKRIKVNEGIVKNIKTSLSKITDGKSVSDTKPISKLVKSISEIEKVTEDTIKIGRFYTVERIEKLNEYYKDTNEKVERMLNLMEVSEDNNFTHDGKSIAVLAKYIHSVAELLSFVSMRFFYYTLLVDTEVAIHTGLREYKESKNPDAFTIVIKSVLDGMEKAIDSLTSIFSKS